MNWKTRIDRAKKTKVFTEDDKELSRLWITDPISELADKIPLVEGELNKGPDNIYLILDGIFFTDGVLKNDINLASYCFDSITERVKKEYEKSSSQF